MAQVAIIGGTGVYASSDWEQPDQIIEKTKFGQVTISFESTRAGKWPLYLAMACPQHSSP